METFNARSITNLIDHNQEKIKRKKISIYYTNTIDELKKEGFEYLKDKVKYNIDPLCYKDIYETGLILIYNSIIIAVCDTGLYVSIMADIYDGVQLDFFHHIDFGPNMYKDLYSKLEEMFKDELC